jgi:UDP:flavonoid glycosyltransferase YjiC (YdhE family)
MARFLICTMPMAGHVNPGLPIARALVRRGHDVWWYTGRHFRAVIEATGAHYVPMQATADTDLEDYFPSLPKLSGAAALNWGIKRAFIDPIPGQVADLRRILAEFPADVLVSDQVFAGAETLHEWGGPPWAMLGVSALTLSSRDIAPANTALPPNASLLGRLRNRALNALLHRVVLRDAGNHANYLRWKLGLPRLRRSLFDLLSPFLYLHSATPAFEYPRSDLPPQVHFIGPLLPAPPRDFVPPSWWDELAGSRPVVLVSQGTIATDPGNLIVPALQALAKDDVLVVVTTGGKPVEDIARAWASALDADQLAAETPIVLYNGLPSGLAPVYVVPTPARSRQIGSVSSNGLPANARVAPFIPFGALLPHVDMMITNGGYGGVQLALAHGVPLIVAGASEDKPEIAARVAWSGAGINLRTKAPAPEQVRAAVQEVLTNPRYRQNAQRIQADYALHNAPEEAAALLERLAATRQPVLRETTPAQLASRPAELNPSMFGRFPRG